MLKENHEALKIKQEKVKYIYPKNILENRI